MILWFLQNRGSVTVWDLAYMIVAYAILVLVMMPVHEFAHAFAAHLCGDDTAKWHGRLTLNPFAHLTLWGTAMMVLMGIGYAKPVPVNTRNFRNYKRDSILVALAGPLSNIAMAILSALVFKILWMLFPTSAALDVLWLVLVEVMVSVNVSLAVFNLLPIPPLDGSRLWSALLPYRAAAFLEQNSRYIMMGLFVLLMTGVLDVPLAFLNNLLLQAIAWIVGL